MKKTLSLLLTLILLLSLFVSAFADTNSFNIDKTIKNILDAKLKASNTDTIQSLVSNVLAKSPTSGEEWYILAFRIYTDDVNYEAYRNALKDYLNNNEIKNVVSKQRIALVCKSINLQLPLLDNIVDETTGKLGLMSYVFGFHLIHNGFQSNTFTEDSIVETLLEKQLPDGGWAISGEHSDVDVTAMVLQALANYSKKDELEDSISKALDFLSTKQADDGCFATFGLYNPESGAQVLLALCGLNIDCTNDSRFIKNGITIIDSFNKFLLPDGTYCHKEGSTSNSLATVEVLYSLCGYKRMVEGKSNFYDFDNLIEPSVDQSITVKEDESRINIKTILYIAIVSLTLLAIVLLAIKGNRKSKSYLSILIVAAIALAAVYFINIESKDSFYNKSNESSETITTSLTIRCDVVAGKSKHIPANGIILENASVKISENSNVYEQLVKAAREYKIQVESQSASGYVEGISNIYEFDFGDLSGWMFRVNGSWSDVGTIEIKLKDGDLVEWLYTVDLGHDIGNDYSNN